MAVRHEVGRFNVKVRCNQADKSLHWVADGDNHQVKGFAVKVVRIIAWRYITKCVTDLLPFLRRDGILPSDALPLKRENRDEVWKVELLQFCFMFRV